MVATAAMQGVYSSVNTRKLITERPVNIVESAAPPNRICSVLTTDSFAIKPEIREVAQRQSAKPNGANTGAINHFITLQRQGLDASAALQEVAAPPGVARFVSATLHIALSAPTHCVAAAFLHGREHVIPAMFKHILQSDELIQHQAPTLYGYLARHIELDTDDHAPAAQLLLERLVSEDPTYPSQAHDTALAAVESRITFWNQVRAALQEARP